MSSISSSHQTARHERSALVLLAQAAGPPRAWYGKIGRLLTTLSAYTKFDAVDKKLSRLRAMGVIEALPNRVQLIVGSYDMLRFWINPAASDYYRTSNIDYTFHQVLRLFDEPASLIDPVGLFSTRDAIIGHVLQVVHANPYYDMQLLMMFDDGLEQMEIQTEMMVLGTHPRSASIGAIVEESDYHERLLSYVRTLRRERQAPPMLRANITEASPFAELERVFGTLSGSMKYFCSLPTDWRGGVRHMRDVRQFAGHLDANERHALTVFAPVIIPDIRPATPPP